MSVKKEASGRRSVQVEVEVPGTPEEVWKAISTGPGISSWFVPTKMDQHVGGKISCHFGPGMDSSETITAWNPPFSFAAEGNDWGKGSPTVATEWTVEAKSGGVCVVRVVHSLFASTDDWDDQLEGTETGWPSFFRILKLYLNRFPGQRGQSLVLSAFPQDTQQEAWDKLSGMLGVSGATTGQHIQAKEDAPQLSGYVEWTGDALQPNSLLLRLDQPAPGLALLAVNNCGGQVMLSITIYLYGDGASETASRMEPQWQSWVTKLFPPAEVPAAG